MKNWKTTLLGAVAAATVAISTYASNGGDLADWKLWVGTIVTALFGYFAKDANVTGTGL